MQKKGNSKEERGGDTSRSSSQGRKASSGGKIQKARRGNPEINEETKTSVKEENRNNKPAKLEGS